MTTYTGQPANVSIIQDGYDVGSAHPLQVLVQGTAATGAAASGNPVQVGGVYNTSAPAPSNGQMEPLQLDSSGNLQTNLFTKIAGEDLTNDVMKVEEQFSFQNITSATTTTIKSGAGVLRALVINKAVASATVAIYDNTAGSGTLIGTITMPATLLSNQASLNYSVKFATGLTIVTTGAQDITVSYR